MNESRGYKTIFYSSLLLSSVGLKSINYAIQVQNFNTVRRSDSQVLYRRAVFKNYAGKHLYGSHFFDKIAVRPTSCSFIKKETSVHALSCESDQIFH